MNAFLFAWRVSRFFPIWVIRASASTGTWVSWLRRGKGARRLEDNLHRVTGLEGRALRGLSRRGMASAARYYAEVLELPRMRGSVIDARVRMIGAEPAVAAVHGKGRMVAALGHSGNWDMVGAFTCRNLGPVTTVAEIIEPREAFEEFLRFREKLGMTVIGHKGSSTFRELIAAAKERGGVLALVADRDLSGSGIRVQMWGHAVRVAPGPAALAIVSDTILLPLSSYYERLRGRRRWAARSKWGTVMDFGPIIEVPSGAKAERIPAMTQAWASYLADGVLRHPEDWHMLQRFGWAE
ncbi:MAG: phosphatidylinositol mannoside acyltransferase [Demequinaceae bacterium]|nr:phosphatidylinositol mannoside acyltransferase [Demequinaceae bacterium]